MDGWVCEKVGGGGRGIQNSRFDSRVEAQKSSGGWGVGGGSVADREACSSWDCT